MIQEGEWHQTSGLYSCRDFKRKVTQGGLLEETLKIQMACQNFFVIWPPGTSVTTWKLEPTSPPSSRERHTGGFFTSFVLSSCTPGHKTKQWKPDCLWGVFKWGPWWQFGGETCYFWFRLLRLFCQMISFSPCVFEAHRIDWSLSQTIPHHFFLFSSFLWNSKSLFRLGS